MSTIGQRIKNRRTELQLTQAELAKRLGKSEAKLKQKKSPQPKPGAMNKQGIYSVILWRWGNMKVCVAAKRSPC